jgi:ankyrin repeat protein
MPLTIEGSTRLIRAAILNDLPRVLQLIQLGAPLNLVDETWESSALHFASYLGHEHVAKALLDGKFAGRGATLDMRDKFGITALSRASNRGHEAIVRLLLSRGADQRMQSNDGKTPLHVAVMGNCAGVIELLCAAPGAAAALALEDHLGLTPLALAVDNLNTTCEAVLRAHGATE